MIFKLLHPWVPMIELSGANSATVGLISWCKTITFITKPPIPPNADDQQSWSICRISSSSTRMFLVAPTLVPWALRRTNIGLIMDSMVASSRT